MKKFFAYIKHLWKDPFVSEEDVKARKKVYTIALLVCIGIVILGGILQAMSIIYIGGGVLVLAAILLWKAKKAEKKFKLLICNECHESMQYTDENCLANVSYKVLSRNFDVSVLKSKTSSGNTEVKVYGSEYSVAELHCKCPKCGAEKKFKFDVKTFDCEIRETVSPSQAPLTAEINRKRIKTLYDEGIEAIPDVVGQLGKLVAHFEHVDGITVKHNRCIESSIADFLVKNSIHGTLSELK